MKRFYVASVLVLTLVLTSCQPIEMTARDAAAAAKGYLDSAKEKHPECATGTQSVQCSIITRGVAAKDSLIDALKIYCASDSFDSGGPCTPNKDAAPKLKAALRDLNVIMGDVRKIGGK